MSHTEKRTEIEEWTVEVCDNCGHDRDQHYNNPKVVNYSDGRYMYTAFGCMSLFGKEERGTRRLEGDNPFLRCECTRFV